MIVRTPSASKSAGSNGCERSVTSGVLIGMWPLLLAADGSRMPLGAIPGPE